MDLNDSEELSALVEQVLSLDNEIIFFESKLKGVKKLLANLIEKEIPLKLQELGLKEATLKDGTKITVDTVYFAKIKQADNEQAYTWLRNNGFGDLIKRRLSIEFTKGEDIRASDIKLGLIDNGCIVKDQESIHHQTLNGFVREQISMGNNIPRDLLGVYQRNEAKVKRKMT